MKKTLFIFVIAFISFSTFAQESYKKKPSLSINFMMNDFRTAERLKANTLDAVISNKKWAKFNEMAPGLSIQYMQGLTEHFDFVSSLGGSFADFNFKNQAGTNTTSTFLLELDANLIAKLLSDKYILSPFLSIGVGASNYKSSYGAYIPFGAGLQVKLSDESFIFTSGQYRVGITDKTANHFNYSIGFAAPLFGNN